MNDYPFLKGWIERITHRPPPPELTQEPEPLEPLPTSPWAVARSIGTRLRPAPPFEGYPYLVSRIGGTFLRHHAILPADWTWSRLRHLARRQAEANRLQTCLVTGPAEAAYFGETGRVIDTTTPPVGQPLHGRLALAAPIPESGEVVARREALEAYCQEHRGKGYLIGDGLEAGRYAIPADMDRYLRGPRDGVPKGLTPCPTCHHLAGEYVAFRGEGNGDTAPRVIQVHCPCENHNRCAACGEPLTDRRLSAWYWDQERCHVTYVAAYAGLDHRCAQPASPAPPLPEGEGVGG